MEKTIEIPEGYEARIEGNKVILERKESEDERIRKKIVDIVKASPFDEEKDVLITWLEKQKEQQPAEWSEEDEMMLDSVLCSLDRIGDYGTIGMQKDWLKSLRPSWKPSEEQIDDLQMLLDDLNNLDNKNNVKMIKVFHWSENYKNLKGLLDSLKKL